MIGKLLVGTTHLGFRPWLVGVGQHFRVCSKPFPSHCDTIERERRDLGPTLPLIAVPPKMFSTRLHSSVSIHIHSFNLETKPLTHEPLGNSANSNCDKCIFVIVRFNPKIDNIYVLNCITFSCLVKYEQNLLSEFNKHMVFLSIFTDHFFKLNLTTP